jgi:alpha-D-ribose 1-methylphosphonate 5-triphosphate synthase subunit PhnH
MPTTRFASDLRLALDPVHDTQAIFRVLLEALARPGVPRQIPVPALDAPANPWVASVLLTVLDHETSFASLADEPTERFVRARTSARDATPATADFVLAEAESLSPALVLELKRGSLAYPDGSATLVVHAHQDTPGQMVHLSGPGIPDGRAADLPFNAAVAEALAEANKNYPCGIDLLLIDAWGRLIGLPRTTRIGRAQ